MSQIYRNKLREYMDFLYDKSTELKNLNNVNSKIFIDLTNDVIVLAYLAEKEIDLDESEQNKCLAKANIGLDAVSHIIFGFHIAVASRLDYEERKKYADACIALMSDISRIDESMLSDSFISNIV